MEWYVYPAIFFLSIVLLYTVFRYNFFYALYVKITDHYKRCPVFARPPGFVCESQKHNKDFEKYRINALVSQYFLFLISAGFILLNIVWYLTYRLGIQNLAGIEIDSTTGYQISYLIVAAPFSVIIVMILIPVLAVNPVVDYLFVLLLQLHKHIGYDGELCKSASEFELMFKMVKYIEFDNFWKRMTYGFIPVYFYYISFRLMIISIFGTEFINGARSMDAVWGAFVLSVAFMVSCRVVSLKEMYDIKHIE